MARNVALLGIALLVAIALGGVHGAGARSLVDPTTIRVEVIGVGTIHDDKGQISCGNGARLCYGTYTSSTTVTSVTLTATAGSGWEFDSWSGDCTTTTDDTCTLTLDEADHEVEAGFTPDVPQGEHTLTVTTTVGGTVTGGEIDCGDDCSDSEYDGSTLTLRAVPDSGYSFGGWEGPCTVPASEPRICSVTLDADKTVSATFRASASTHTLNVSVTGNGTVAGAGGQISCTSAGDDCSADLTAGQQVTLTATAGSGAAFTGWGGDCNGTSTTCTLTMSANRSVTASFTGAGGGAPTLTVSVTGAGKVTGAGIDCGNGATTCSARETNGATVTLTATPASGSTFQSWGGACSGSSRTCAVTMSGSKLVSATFESAGPPPANSSNLTVRVSGNGTVSGPGGTCAAGGTSKTCIQTYATGATATLTATPGPGGRFISWGGACSGSNRSCTVSLTADKTVTATFSGARTPAAQTAALRSRGRPLVTHGRNGYNVTLRFTTSTRGTAHVRALRAGRQMTALTIPVPRGPVNVGPFPVARAGYYTFEIRLGPRTLRWRACLGRCGAAAAAPAFDVTRGAASAVHGGAVWSVTLHFRETLPSEARVRIFRGRRLARDYRFLPSAGLITAGPFLLSPGTYTFRLTATDAFGRTGRLTWFAVLP